MIIFKDSPSAELFEKKRNKNIDDVEWRNNKESKITLFTQTQ